MGRGGDRWYQCQRVTRACKLLPSHFRSNLGIHGLVEEDEVQHLLKDVLIVPRGAAVFPRPQSAHGDHAVPDLLQLSVLHHLVLPPTADGPRRGDGRLLGLPHYLASGDEASWILVRFEYGLVAA